MKNRTEYSNFNDQEIKNYVNYNYNVICTESKPIWTLKYVYTILLINIYENNKNY